MFSMHQMPLEGVCTQDKFKSVLRHKNTNLVANSRFYY